jgi:microcystin-dependent protein
MSGPLTPGNFTYAPEATTAARDNDFYVLSSAPAPAVTGVTQIVASNSSITVSPAGGTGVVTLTVPPPIFPPSEFVTGMIMMWGGSTAPTGWALCNGLNGTPDLREKFICGSSTLVPIGSTGGATSVTLSLNNLPDHTHGGVGLSTVSSPVDTGGYSYASTSGVTTGVTGLVTTTPFNIVPPFYALAYIIKL